MATGQFQHGSFHNEDRPFKNYGVADIPEGRIVLADAANDGDAGNAPGIVLPTASGGFAGQVGITVETIPPGRTGRVRVRGAFPVPADGAITYGLALRASDTTGKLGYAKAAGAGEAQLGQAMNTVADGETVLAEIDKATNA